MIDKTSYYITCIYFMYRHLIAWTVIYIYYFQFYKWTALLLSPYGIYSSCTANFVSKQHRTCDIINFIKTHCLNVKTTLTSRTVVLN